MSEVFHYGILLQRIRQRPYYSTPAMIGWTSRRVSESFKNKPHIFLAHARRGWSGEIPHSYYQRTGVTVVTCSSLSSVRFGISLWDILSPVLPDKLILTTDCPVLYITQMGLTRRRRTRKTVCTRVGAVTSSP